MVAPEATPKRFTVTHHALEAYRNRYPGRLSRKHLESQIREHVLTGIADGHVYDHKPEGFLLYGQRPDRLKDGTRFIYRQPNASVGFIVKRLPQEDIVITTLVRVGARR